MNLLGICARVVTWVLIYFSVQTHTLKLRVIIAFNRHIDPGIVMASKNNEVTKQTKISAFMVHIF